MRENFPENEREVVGMKKDWWKMRELCGGDGAPVSQKFRERKVFPLNH